MFKISLGAELDEWREILESVDFLVETEEKRKIRNTIEKLSQNYQETFKDSFVKKNDAEEIKSSSIRRLGSR
jgi:nicotinic acid mononucleotide adenylyltransferase